MPLLLRDYQSDLMKRARAAIRRSGSVVIQLETGAGKTHIAAEMCRGWARKGMRVWFVAHRQEILDQARAIFDDGGVKHGPGRLIQFKMIAAAVKNDGDKPDVLVFDECHHAPAASWAKVVAANPKAVRLGLTATPGRLDRAPLSDTFSEIVLGPPARELRANNHLAGYRYFAPVLPDLSKVKIRKNEYDRESVTEIMTGSAIVGDVVAHYNRHAKGKRAILFAVSVKASQDMAARFVAAGIPAIHVDAKTSDEDRAAAVKSLRSGRVKVLCNVELFTEGFDVPAVGAIILLRPTRSLALCRQMIGRGSRFTRPGAKTVILDHAALVVEHGLPDEEYEWTLDGGHPRRRKSVDADGQTRLRRCPECAAIHEWASSCNQCGHQYNAGFRDVSEIGGVLNEIMQLPPGYMTMAEYARRRGLHSSAVYSRVKRGMPLFNGFVDPDVADKWSAERASSLSERRSTIMRRRLADKEIREAHIARLKDPCSREKVTRYLRTSEARAAAKARASNTIQGTKAKSKLREKMLQPEYRAALSERAKQQMSDPKRRKAQSDFMKKTMGTPEAREANRARNSTPEARAAQSARRAAAVAAKKRGAPKHHPVVVCGD